MNLFTSYPHPTHRSKKTSGFTIVELLIVIVVIAILAAISVVAYNGIQERARLSSAKTFEHQIKNAYLADATGYWTFDECTGSVAKDSTGVNDGAIVGTTSWSTDTPSGSGYSLSLNGSTRVDIASQLSNAHYIKAAWIKVTERSCEGKPLNIISSGDNSTHVLYIFGCQLYAGHNEQWNYVRDTSRIDDGKWHYVVVEYKRDESNTYGTLKLYRDGRLISENSKVPPMTGLSGRQQIGGYRDRAYFTGLIDNPLVIAQ